MDDAAQREVRQELGRKRRSLVVVVVAITLSVAYAVVIAVRSGLWWIPVFALIAGGALVVAVVRRYRSIVAGVRAAGYDDG